MPAGKKKSSSVAHSFEEAAEELEVITRRLEEDPGSLAGLLEDFERGQALLSYCQNTLKSTRKRLDLVEAKLQTDMTEDESDNSSKSGDDTHDDDVRLF